MKNYINSPLLYLLLLYLTACTQPSPAIEAETEWQDEPLDTASMLVSNMISEDQNYLEDLDFDGDGFADELYFEYTGGAHCCYKLSLQLSSTLETYYYPFEMDGGYGFGVVDGSLYDQFDIGDYDDDQQVEIFMVVSTYNGVPYEIYEEWTKEYGFKGNYIIFDFRDGQIIVEDYDAEKYKLELKSYSLNLE